MSAAFHDIHLFVNTNGITIRLFKGLYNYIFLNLLTMICELITS